MPKAWEQFLKPERKHPEPDFLFFINIAEQ
jgi:hypothetical protein